jgi:hypothetical protein
VPMLPCYERNRGAIFGGGFRDPKKSAVPKAYGCGPGKGLTSALFPTVPGKPKGANG